MRGRIWGRALAGLAVSICAFLALTGAASATGLRATFTGGPQGWENFIFGGPAAWSGTGGNPSGHILQDAHPEGLISLGTNAWSGNRRSAFGGTVSFDLRLEPGQRGEPHIRMDRPDPGDPIIHQLPEADSSGAWQHYEAGLRPQGWRTPDGMGGSTPTTELEMKELLANFASMNVAVFELDEGDIARVDNVTFAANVKRRLTIGYTGRKFKGKLSPAGPCAMGQKVVVYRKKRGADAKIGKDRTNARGRYSVREPDARVGGYYAKAAASFKAGAGNCLSAKSKVLAIRRPT